MALIFQRIARNFIKHGYFPTDSDTLSCLIAHLALPDSEAGVTLFDPTVGEGTALAEIAHSLRESGCEKVKTYGVEIESGRGWYAKKMLDEVIIGDLMGCRISPGVFSFALVNPPYGHQMKNQVGGEKSERIEHKLTEKAVSALRPGGVLALIVPRYSITASFANYLARRFEGVSIHEAPEQRFKQIVLLGYKRQRVATVSNAVAEGLVKQASEAKPLPPSPVIEPYRLPVGDSPAVWKTMVIDPNQLYDEIKSGIDGIWWPSFDAIFQNKARAISRPLMPLGKWHTGLALAAGLIESVVYSDDGKRIVFVKGRTIKTKEIRHEADKDSKGNSVEKSVQVDRFTPIIFGIDLTDGENFGSLLKIV